jgi:O-antigen/teichoic acid export membrane protein
MSPYFFLAFTVSPLSRTLLVAEKQRENLLWQVSLALVTVAALFVGVRAKRPAVSIALYSLSYSMMYLFYLRMSYRYAKGELVVDIPALPNKAPHEVPE